MAGHSVWDARRRYISRRCFAGFVWVLLWSGALVSDGVQGAEPGVAAQPAASSGWVGIRVEDVHSVYARELGVRAPRGAMLSVVYPGSPAEHDGLKPGDVITSFNGAQVNSCHDLELAVGQTTVSGKYRVEFYRGEQFFFVELTTGRRMPAPAGGYGQIPDLRLLGDSAGTKVARDLGISAAAGMAVAQVIPGGAAAQAGLRRGDLIVMFGGREINVFEDYQAAFLQSPIGSQQPVAFVRAGQRQETTMAMIAGPRRDPLRWYAHPQGAFRFVLPPSWYLFPKDQPGEPPENQFDRVISATGAYQFKLFKSSRRAPQAELALEQFVRTQLQSHPNAQSARGQLGVCPAAWVAIHSPDERFLLYRISFVQQGRRYNVDALAPLVCDPEKLPGPVDWVLQSIESLPSGIARGDQTPEAKPSDSSTSSPEPAKVPAGWITKNVGDVTVSVPPDWTESEFSAQDEGLWYKGDPLRPDVSFSIMRDMPFAELSRDGTVKSTSPTTVGGVSAARFLIDGADPDRPERGIVVVLGQRVGQRASTALVGFAVSGQWDQYEKVLQQILACVRIGAAAPAREN